MKYNLALDIGVGSASGTLTKLDRQGNPIDFINSGDRIFRVSEGAKERRLRSPCIRCSECYQRLIRRSNITLHRQKQDTIFKL